MRALSDSAQITLAADSLATTFWRWVKVNLHETSDVRQNNLEKKLARLPGTPQADRLRITAARLSSDRLA
jgi:hypothetical protein